MKTWHGALIIVALMVSFSLAACGGGGSDTVAGGGIGGTGYVASGTITAFGSIVVNDVEFDTTKVDVIIGGVKIGTGNQAVRDNLDVGQAVVVEGIENDDGLSGIALRVWFTPNVKGPVTEIADIDGNTKRIVVLGQTIIADANTVFRDAKIGDLIPGDLIEVSGLVEAAGAVGATYVKKMPGSFDPLTEVEIKGIIRDLDSTAKTFRLNGLVVHYERAAIGDLPGGTPKSAQLVHVTGKVGTGVTLVADEIELADETKITSADRVDLEGVIAGLVSGSDFMVGYLQVAVGPDTKFHGGAKDELTAGARIRVKGRLVNGILEAQQIFFRKK